MEWPRDSLAPGTEASPLPCEGSVRSGVISTSGIECSESDGIFGGWLRFDRNVCRECEREQRQRTAYDLMARR